MTESPFSEELAPSRSRPPWQYALVAVPLLVAGLVFWWGYNRAQPHQFSGAVIQGLTAAPDFSLSSDSGPVSLSDHRGKLVVLYFGYTFCPDVCPTTLQDVADAIEILDDDDAKDVQLIFVTVDPVRDTAERLGEYVRHFDESFLGVTGTEEEIGSVATLYGIYYRAGEGSEATGYLMEHTATLLVIDREGNLKEVIPFGVDSEGIAADFEYMLR